MVISPVFIVYIIIQNVSKSNRFQNILFVLTLRKNNGKILLMRGDEI